MAQPRKYPAGVQSFAEIRENGYLYIDKTEYIYNLTHTPARYYFLSRPRRFGKTLLTKTFRCYFEGRKDLFAGLAIDSLEKEWKKYPVLHFDLSRGKAFTTETLNDYIHSILLENEVRLGFPESDEKNTNIRLNNLIVNTYRKYNSQAVVLIDEYDAPLLDVAHDDELLNEMRDILRNFYSPLKGCDDYLRFVFLTGITKFSQLSIFSELNNIVNISMDDEYAAICGISDEELHEQMHSDIAYLAEKHRTDTDNMFRRIKEYYDGYHFSPFSPDVYNPYSLMLALTKKVIQPYWFESGTPTFIIKLLNKYGIKPSYIKAERLPASRFNVPVEDAKSSTPLMVQSGYLTIKDYDPISQLFTIDIPNREVLTGLMDSMLSSYVGNKYNESGTLVGEMRAAIYHDNMDEALTLLQTFLATVPYCDNTQYEGHYQQILYIIFTLLGANCDVENRTAKGRIDLTLTNSKRIFVMEIKVDASAQAALDQIEEKRYADRFALAPLPVTKIGINFSTTDRNITDWKISE